jgi:hypothetical protein
MPLPPPPIQIRPPGLLSLLGIQNGGKTPDQLSGFTQGTFELSDWYLRAKWEQLPQSSLTIPNGANGGYVPYTTNPILVPPNEWWYVENYSASLNVVGADTMASGSALGFASQSISYVVSAASAGLSALATQFLTSLRPFWVPPGSSIGLQLSNAAIAGASLGVGRLLIARVLV